MAPETVLIPTPAGVKLEVSVFTPLTPGPHPAIVMGPAGYAAITLDYVSFGGSEGEPRNVVFVWDEYRDYCAVIKWVQQQPAFQKDRVVAWGTSFGGMHVTRLLAEDYSIAAGIAQCPCVDGQLASRMKPAFKRLRLSFWAICDLVGSYIGLSPIYLRLANTPDENGLAIMDTSDTAEGWARLHAGSVGEHKGLLANRIAARSMLSFPFSRPGLGVGRSIAPLLIVAPTYDSVAPLSAAEEAAERAPKGELLRVSGGHFDLYKGGIGFDDNLKGQLEFLKRIMI